MTKPWLRSPERGEGFSCLPKERSSGKLKIYAGTALTLVPAYTAETKPWLRSPERG